MKAFLAVFMLLLPVAVFADEPVVDDTLSLGFSAGLFSDVNEADAIASIKVWADTILVRRGIGLASAPSIYSNIATMKEDLLAGRVDVVSLLTEEFFLLEKDVELEHLHYTLLNGRISEEYLLLVRKREGIKSLNGLQGKTLAVVEGARLALSRMWLETLLMESGEPGLEPFFAAVAGHAKTSRAVLGVFFGKTDACLATRAGFETMVELNPQIGKQLAVLETSPEFIPGLVCIRKDWDERLKNEVIAGLHELGESVRGRQILTVFKADELVEGPVEELSTTREWIARHTLLKSSLDSALKTAEVSQ